MVIKALRPIQEDSPAIQRKSSKVSVTSMSQSGNIITKTAQMFPQTKRYTYEKLCD